MGASWRIAPEVLDLIEREARTSFPNECCGVLIGRRRGGVAWLVQAVPARNVTGRNPRRSFEIDPTLLLALQKSLRGSPEFVAGFYHSHPRGVARPSPRDVGGATGGEIWMIAALDGPGRGLQLTSWQCLGSGRTKRFRLARLTRQ